MDPFNYIQLRNNKLPTRLSEFKAGSIILAMCEISVDSLPGYLRTWYHYMNGYAGVNPLQTTDDASKQSAINAFSVVFSQICEISTKMGTELVKTLVNRRGLICRQLLEMLCNDNKLDPESTIHIMADDRSAIATIGQSIYSPYFFSHSNDAKIEGFKKVRNLSHKLLRAKVSNYHPALAHFLSCVFAMNERPTCSTNQVCTVFYRTGFIENSVSFIMMGEWCYIFIIADNVAKLDLIKRNIDDNFHSHNKMVPCDCESCTKLWESDKLPTPDIVREKLQKICSWAPLSS